MAAQGVVILSGVVVVGVVGVVVVVGVVIVVVVIVFLVHRLRRLLLFLFLLLSLLLLLLVAKPSDCVRKVPMDPVWMRELAGIRDSIKTSK